MASVGFVGLGVMGGGIARRLLDAGHQLVGWNRTKEKAAPLVQAGMSWCDTPREVAERSDVVFSMVTNVAALEAITDGPDGLLAALGVGQGLRGHEHGQPVCESRARGRACGRRVPRCWTRPSRAASRHSSKGSCRCMIGGDATTFARVEPILRDIGPVVTHVGENGQAVLMKIAHNLSLAVQMLAFSEGVLLAEKGGIDREWPSRS